MSNTLAQAIDKARHKQHALKAKTAVLSSRKPIALASAPDNPKTNRVFSKVNVFDFDDQNGAGHSLFRIDTRQENKITQTDLVWHTSSHHVNQAVRAGILKPPALTAQAIATLGQYHKKKNRELYHFHTRTRLNSNKLKLLDFTQDLIECIQPIERLTANDDSDSANTLMNKAALALSTLLEQQNNGCFSTLTAAAPWFADRFYALIIKFTKRLQQLRASYQAGTINNNQLNDCLRYMLLDIVNLSQDVNQEMAFKQSHANRGAYHSVCQDARRVIDGYLFDPHNPITTAHQCLSADASNKSDLICLPVSELGDSTHDMENSLMAISQIEGHDAVQVGEDTVRVMPGDHTSTAAAADIAYRRVTASQRVRKYFSRRKKTAKDADPNYQIQHLGQYREFEHSTYALLCDSVKLKKRPSMTRQLFRAAGLGLWRATIGGIWTVGKETLKEAWRDLRAGFWYDWRETLGHGNFKPEKRERAFDALIALLDRHNPPEPFDNNHHLNIAHCTYGLETGIDNRDLLNLFSSHVQHTLDGISYDIHGKNPVLGAVFSSTLAISTLALMYPAQFGGLCKMITAMQCQGPNPTLNIIDTAYTTAFATEESLAILSGSKNSLLRQMAQTSFENLPAIIAAAVIIGGLYALLPQTVINDIVQTCKAAAPGEYLSANAEMAAHPGMAVALQLELRALSEAICANNYFGRDHQEQQHINQLLDEAEKHLAATTQRDKFLMSLQHHETILSVLPYAKKRLILAETKALFPKDYALQRHVDGLLFPKQTHNFIVNTLLIIATYPTKLLRLIATAGVVGDSARNFKNKFFTDVTRLVHTVTNVTDSVSRFVKTSLHTVYDIVANLIVARLSSKLGYRLQKRANAVDRSIEWARNQGRRGPNSFRSRTTSHSIRARDLKKRVNRTRSSQPPQTTLARLTQRLGRETMPPTKQTQQHRFGDLDIIIHPDEHAAPETAEHLDSTEPTRSLSLPSRLIGRDSPLSAASKTRSVTDDPVLVWEAAAKTDIKPTIILYLN